jgi:hypothetical protein
LRPFLGITFSPEQVVFQKDHDAFFKLFCRVSKRETDVFVLPKYVPHTLIE